VPTQTFYRIVVTDPPSLIDFTSDVAQGRPTRSRDPEVVRLASGLSVYATIVQARNKARAYRWLGSYIARLELPEVGRIHYERTLLGSRGHHTVWGEPVELLSCVVAVVPVEGAE
jgi:hypothetical protein